MEEPDKLKGDVDEDEDAKDETSGLQDLMREGKAEREMTQDEASEDEGALEKQIVSSTQKALKILLRRIISPNAP